MKRLMIGILVVVMMMSFWTSPAQAVEEDKVLHASVSFVVATGAYNFFRKEMEWSPTKARVGAFVTAMAVGAAKELFDDEFDGEDMAADAGGALLGVAIGWEF